MTPTAARAVALPCVLDLDCIEAVRDGLLEAIEEGAVVIGAAEVERVSTNGLLMLISAAETARRNQSGFALVGVSQAMATAIDRLGLGGPFAAMIKE